jgi:endoglucanase
LNPISHKNILPAAPQFRTACIYSFQKTLLFLFIFLSFDCSLEAKEKIYIRLNQVGFLPEDLKTAVVFSDVNLDNKFYEIFSTKNEQTILKNSLKSSSITVENFDHAYEIEFSSLVRAGEYRLKIGDSESFPFLVGSSIFNHVADSLLLFFKVQRCGPTDPYLHKVCHLYDVERIIGEEPGISADLTGGWHDAGDYIKFLSTTALATYLMIFAYEFDPIKYGFDRNGDGVPDILEEAKVGLDWLLRCNYSKDKLITQVQDLRDHEAGWRLPEDDSLRYNRPGFLGIGKNQIGIYTAVMSLAYRIWKEKFLDEEFAGRCLTSAVNIFSLRHNAPDIDKSYTGFYQDDNFLGKLALGAVELYLSTGEKKYLNEASEYAHEADADYWWSWGNVNSLAHYKLAKIDPDFIKYLEKNLNFFNEKKDSSIFKEATGYTWGSTNTFLGAALQAILYKDLTASSKYDSLAVYQRDFVLGRNRWGMSFIYNIGQSFPQNLHSQIAFFNNGRHPGALAGGPVSVDIFEKYEIKRVNFANNIFNLDSLKYFDDRHDYLTNEPSIISNATALFVFGFYIRETN